MTLSKSELNYVRNDIKVTHKLFKKRGNLYYRFSQFYTWKLLISGLLRGYKLRLEDDGKHFRLTKNERVVK